MRDMEDIDKAARRTAINLMRLNEALEMADADEYPTTKLPSHTFTRREHRRDALQRFYRRWFGEKA